MENPGPTVAFAQPHLGYRRELDGLRGLAILAVMAIHFGGWLCGGYLGVDVFFVLSGFLITHLLLEEWHRNGSISLKQFYLRRAFRLLPALLVMVLVTEVAFTLDPPPGYSRTLLLREAGLTLLYLRNYASLMGISCSGVFQHTWSLAVEEHFYLSWPLAFCLLIKLRCSPRAIACLLVAAIVAFAALRYSLCHGDLNRNFPQLYCRSEARADALLCGCLAGVLVAARLLPESASFRAALCAAAQACAVGLVYCVSHADVPAWMNSLLRWGFTPLALAVAVVVVAIITASHPLVVDLLGSALLVWIGRISYSLYLWHIPVQRFFTPERLGVSPERACWIHYLLSFLLGVASFYLIERPALRLKTRFTADRRTVPSGESSRAAAA